jgi:hypothetical protein
LTVSPDFVNEIRDLQAFVQRTVLNLAFALASVLAVVSFIVAAGAIRVAAMTEEVWAVTFSGQTFRVAPLPDEVARQILTNPAAQRAVREAEASR